MEAKKGSALACAIRSSLDGAGVDITDGEDDVDASGAVSGCAVCCPVCVISTSGVSTTSGVTAAAGTAPG